MNLFLLANDDKDTCLFIKKLDDTYHFVVYFPVPGHMAILKKVLRSISTKFYKNARAYGLGTANARARSTVLAWTQIFDFISNASLPFQKIEYMYYDTKKQMFKKRSLTN